MSKKQTESGYYKKYYQEHKELFKKRHLNGYHKKYREDNKESIQKHRDDNKLRSTNYHLLRYYNITLEDYNNLFLKQNGCCAICGVHQTDIKKKLCIDHDHITNKVRGLLCNNCNLALGHTYEDPSILLKMVDYLKEGLEP